MAIDRGYNGQSRVYMDIRPAGEQAPAGGTIRMQARGSAGTPPANPARRPSRPASGLPGHHQLMARNCFGENGSSLIRFPLVQRPCARFQSFKQAGLPCLRLHAFQALKRLDAVEKFDFHAAAPRSPDLRHVV